MLHCDAMPVQDSLCFRRPGWGRILLALVCLAFLAAGTRSEAQSSTTDLRADVVVIVGTSISMAQPGLDPERASLLVTKLLVDLVPGKLAVVRLVDLVADAIPSAPTGQKAPCEDDPSKTCDVVAMPKDLLDQIRKSKLAALIRDTQGSASFKQSLNRSEEHTSELQSHSFISYAVFCLY